MRIAIFTETYLPQINGVVTHIKILKEGLEALGHTVLIVTADSKPANIILRIMFCTVRPTISNEFTVWILLLRLAVPAYIIFVNLTQILSMYTMSSASV